MTPADVVVLRFGGTALSRERWPGYPSTTSPIPTDVDSVRRRAPDDRAWAARRTWQACSPRLLRADRLDVEVALVRPTVAARRARTAAARRVPLIRDETGTVVTEAAFWLPTDETARTISGEAVVDDTVLFDGEVTGVRIEPTADLPGLRASVLTGRMRPRTLGHRARRPARHDGRAGGARRRRGAAPGPAVDVLPAHAGLVGRPVT